MALIERRHQEHPSKRSFWNELLKNEMNWPSIFGQSELHPAINIKENENAYELELAVPGYNQEDFKVDIEKGLMTIKAEVKAEKEEQKANYSRKEFSYKSFERSFSVPENIEEDAILAKYDNGVLTFTLPKTSKEELPEPKKAIKID